MGVSNTRTQTTIQAAVCAHHLPRRRGYAMPSQEPLQRDRARTAAHHLVELGRDGVGVRVRLSARAQADLALAASGRGRQALELHLHLPVHLQQNNKLSHTRTAIHPVTHTCAHKLCVARAFCV